MKYKTFAEALLATPTERPKAANDNRPRKSPEPRYRGTLPALRWLYDNHPDLAEHMADAVKALTVTTWDSDASDNDQEIRPTVGELMKASTDEDGQPIKPTVEHDRDGNPFIQLGALKFARGQLVEYGKTRKGRKLQPRDRIVSRDEEPAAKRSPITYVFHVRPTTPSPLHAESYQRPFSGEPALAPMYDPQSGVEKARAELKSFGVDGAVPFEELPFPATKCPPAIAKGAEFLGGIVGLSGTSSSGAIMWEAPYTPKGEVLRIVEEIASGATLKEIGERMALSGTRVDRGAKELVVDAARALVAANDNSKKKNAA